MDQAGLDFDAAAWRPTLRSAMVVENIGRLVLNPDTAASSLESEEGAFRRELELVAGLARRALAEFDRVLGEVTSSPQRPDEADRDPEPDPPRRRLPRAAFDLGQELAGRIEAEMKRDASGPTAATEPLLRAYERHLRSLALGAEATATRAVAAVQAHRQPERRKRRRRRPVPLSSRRGRAGAAKRAARA
jgi:hypothetical protein